MTYKIMLVNPPTEDKDKNSNYACFPSINIVQLATRIKQDYGDKIDVKVVDGGIYSKKEIESRIDEYKPNMLGISALTLTYKNAMELANRAKTKYDSKIVLGNDNASFFPELILEKQKSIDYLITNDVGETPFSNLVGYELGEKDIQTVDSLYYKQDSKIKHNKKLKHNLSKKNTVPNLEFILDDIKDYSDNYMDAFGHLHDKVIKPMTINYARGCKNFKNKCEYCSISDLRFNIGNTNKFWKTVKNYNEKYGINFFFEVFDSFLSRPDYVDNLIKTMPIDIKKKIKNEEIEFMVYTNASDLINKNNIQRLKQLGIKRVNVGIDSGDKISLENQKHDGITPEGNKQALRNLKEAGMTIHASFIAGARGETKQSLDNSVNFIQEIIETYHEKDKPFFSSIEFSRMIPMPNSKVWQDILRVEPNFHKDIIDIEETTKRWFENYTNITEEYALQKIKCVDDLLLKKGITTGKNVG